MKKLRGAPHTGRGHGGAARQSRRGHKTVLDVFEKSTQVVELKCQSCKATANATVYRVTLPNPHAETEGHPLRTEQPFNWTWVQLPPNWWSLRLAEGATPLGSCGTAYRCPECIGGDDSE